MVTTVLPMFGPLPMSLKLERPPITLQRWPGCVGCVICWAFVVDASSAVIALHFLRANVAGFSEPQYALQADTIACVAIVVLFELASAVSAHATGEVISDHF